jgi:hypothetical protein
MKIPWRGREWTIRVATQDEAKTFLDEKYAELFGNTALIVYHPDASDDSKIMAILHEIAHEMFPEWNAEPHEKSKSELGIFERDLKAFLDACGIDLSPLLEE